jgi:hypothetical protein
VAIPTYVSNGDDVASTHTMVVNKVGQLLTSIIVAYKL